MTRTTTPNHTVSVLRPTGVETAQLPQRFDVHEIEEFEARVQRIASRRSVLVLDASEVRYIDLAAMDALIRARLTCMDNGGELALAAPSSAARIILELSGRYDALNPIDAESPERGAAVLEEAA